MQHNADLERTARRLWGCGAGLTKDQAIQAAEFLATELAEPESEAPDGILKYLCWACPLRIEGPYAYVLPLVDAHEAEHDAPGGGE